MLVWRLAMKGTRKRGCFCLQGMVSATTRERSRVSHPLPPRLSSCFDFTQKKHLSSVQNVRTETAETIQQDDMQKGLAHEARSDNNSALFIRSNACQMTKRPPWMQ